MAALQTEQPPSYAKATEAQDPDGPPPTYEQIFGVKQMTKEVRDAKENSSNKGLFALKFFGICCGSIACTICSVVLLPLPITMIIIGSIYLDDCPVNRLIPVWLIVFGVFSVVQALINIFKRCVTSCNKDNNDDDRREYGKHSGNCCESLLSTFLFVWIIVGSVWVFRFYPDFHNCVTDSTRVCCHPAPYLLAFSVLIAIYSLGALVLLCICGCFCFCAFLSGVSCAFE